MRSRITNELRGERRRQGWSQTRAAEAAGITRQAYAAIEAGRSVPSTEVALRLARALGRPVEDLFHLPDEGGEPVRAVWGGAGREPGGRRVRLVRVGGRRVAVPTDGSTRPNLPADGVVSSEEGGTVRVTLLPDRPPAAELAVVGCDPAFGIVAEALRSRRRIETAWTPASSQAALEALARGAAHVAGSHLRDARTAEPNGPWVRRLVPHPCTRIRFAVWEEGLLVAPGNPLDIRTVADLARPGIRFLNREAGAGARMLLDEELERAAIPSSRIEGYDAVARGHLAVAEAVASGLADAGVAIRAAGAAFGLDVVPLRSNAYELVMPDHFLDLEAVQALLETLRRPALHAQVEALQGYDTSAMGTSA